MERLPRVVVLDDNRVDAKSALRELRGVAEAIRVERPEPTPGFEPDIVLCDLAVPPLYGSETLEAAKRAWPGALIVPWSGHRELAGMSEHEGTLLKGSPEFGEIIRRHVRSVVLGLVDWVE